MKRYVLGGAVLASLAVLSLSEAPSGLRDGDLLDRDRWQEARGLLPEEILDHYRNGEYANRIVDLSLPAYRDVGFPPEFRAASEANLGRFEVDEAGTIIDVETGRQPRYIMGLPFPEIDPDDPRAGVKIVWNFNYVTWYSGDEHFLNELVMLGEAGVQRRVATEVQTRIYDGAPEARDRDNPDNLVMQRLARVVSPADMAGTTSLSWRYRDADRHDSLWTFVPGTRRVRQVSSLNRSDGFMGSDISMDDGPFFDGKPEDFDFRLLGKKDQLVLMDPFSLRGEADLVKAGAGWRIVWKDVPRIGADLEGWQGLPWAPVSAVLARRQVWVVEARPKDPNYLYGRIELRLDAQTYHGSWASKYDRADQLLTSYQAARGTYFSPDGGKTWLAAGGFAVRIGESAFHRRATVVLFPPRNDKNPADYHVDNPPELFTTNAMLRFGK